MPFYTPDANDPGQRQVLGVTPPAPQPAPALTDIVGAAFRQDNDVVSAVHDIRNSGAFTYDPSHNPMDVIRGTKYEQDYKSNFLGSGSEAETRSIMSKIDGEEKDRQTLDAGGAVGFAAQTIAGLLDPTILMPAGEFVKAGRGGYSAIRSGLRIGLAGGAQALAQETILHATQESRPMSQSIGAVGSATLLSGLIGSTAAKFLSRGEYEAVAGMLDRERAETDLHAGNVPPPLAEKATEPGVVPNVATVEAAPEGVPAAESTAGAAQTDTRKLELAPSFGVGKVTAGFDPMSRMLNAASLSVRRAAADLAETPLLFLQNLRGEVTTSGPPLERVARLQINQTRVAVSDELARQFADYRFGNADARAPRLQAAWQDIRGAAPEGKMTYEEFKREIATAMQEGDKHEIPQVQAGAQFVRAKVFDPWKERAIKAGLLPEGVETKTADSYFQRVYDKQKITAKRPEFVDTVTGWLKADQTNKAAAQDRIGSYRNGLDVAKDQIAKLTDRIAKLSEDAEVVQARQEEATRVNKFAFQRSTELRESQYRNDGGIRVEVPGKNIEKARGGAVFETKVRNRGNELADRVSAKLSEIEQLEQKLSAETANHDSLRTKIETEIAAWEGKSTAEAKSALKLRKEAEAARLEKMTAGNYKGKGERLASADDAVDKAVRRIIESDRDLSDGELRDRAHEITQRILGSPDGRLPYDLASGGPEIGYVQGGGEAPRGPLAAREFNIPDQMIREFLEQDVEHVVQTHLRTMVPDVLLTERFGDVRMTEAFRKVEDDYARLIDETKNAKDRTKLGKEREASLRDLAAVRDRLRGVYGLDVYNSMKGAGRVAAAAKNLNVLSSMGMATVSSLPDMAGAIFRWGLGTVFRDAWAPFTKSLLSDRALTGEATRQFRAMGIAIETFAAQRHHALADVMDAAKPQSQFERTLQWGADKFQLLNMLGPWTDMQKVMASIVASQELFRAAEAHAAGKATKRQLRALGENNIDASMAARIAKEYRETGNKVDGVHLPNTGEWKDASAREVFEGAIAREADIAVVSPGQEKPLWLSNPIVSVLGQFKSFTAAATQRILIANLQRRDAQVLQGLVATMAFGMMSYKVNAMLGGQPTSDRPADWIKESMSRGNLFGWFEEGNALTSKMTRGTVDAYRILGANKPLSRYAGRSVLDQMLGPTAGKIEALAQVTGAAAKADWGASDTKALRKLTAFQNLFWLRGVLNQVEAGANNAFGIPQQAERPPVH